MTTTMTMQFKPTDDDEIRLKKFRDFLTRKLEEDEPPRRKATIDDIRHVVELLGCRQILRRLWLDAAHSDTDYARDFTRRVDRSDQRAVRLLKAACESTVMDDEDLLNIVKGLLIDAEGHFSAGEESNG